MKCLETAQATGRYALEEIASRCKREQAEGYLARPGASDSRMATVASGQVQIWSKIIRDYGS